MECFHRSFCSTCVIENENFFAKPLVALQFSANFAAIRSRKDRRKRSSPVTASDSWTLSDGNRSRRRVWRKPDASRRRLRENALKQSLRMKNTSGMKNSPMAKFLIDDRNVHIYGKHVVEAIRVVRHLSSRTPGSYDIRILLSKFIGKLTFRQMCTVLREQKGWRSAAEFFGWMKTQLCYTPNVAVYTILLNVFGQAGKLDLAEETFMDMLEVGCEPDEVACWTMIRAYARWGRHTEMLSFYSSVRNRGIAPSIIMHNYIIASLHKASLHRHVIELCEDVFNNEGLKPNGFTFSVLIDSYSKEDRSKQSLKLFEEMRSQGFIPSEITYNIVINMVIKLDMPEYALRLFDDMRSHNVLPNIYTCASLLNLCYKTGNAKNALSIIEFIKRHKYDADEVTYGIIINIYGKLGLYEDAERTFNELEQFGSLTQEKTYAAMSRVYIKMGAYDKAMNVIRNMQDKNIKISNISLSTLLQCHIMQKNMAAAEMTFQTMRSSGHLDKFTYSNMLNLYAHEGFRDKIKEIVKDLREKFTEFDNELYGVIMKACCKADMIEEAELLVEEMRAKGMVLNQIMKTTLIQAYGKAGRNMEMISLFETLKDPDIVALSSILYFHISNSNEGDVKAFLNKVLKSPNGTLTGSQLIIRFVKEGMIDKARLLYNAISELGLRPSNSAVASLIRYYGQHKQLGLACSTFQSFSCSGSQMESQVYNSMLDAYAKCGKVEDALSLFNELEKQGYHHDKFIISSMVNALTQHGKFEEAEELIQNCIGNKLPFDTVTYNTFIKAKLDAGKLDDAVNFFKEMQCNNVTPSLQTYNTMISVYAKAGNIQRSVEIFKSLSNSGISIDEMTYGNMIGCYGKAGLHDDATSLFSKMEQDGIRRGKITYKIMMDVYARSGLHIKAESLIGEMHKNGHIPDSYTYLLLIHAYTNSHKLKEAEEVLRRMQKQGVRPELIHFKHLLTEYKKSNMVKHAVRLYYRIQRAGLTPNLACHKTMMEIYHDCGQPQEGIRFFQKLKNNTKLDNDIHKIAARLYKSCGKNKEAAEVLLLQESNGEEMQRILEA